MLIHRIQFAIVELGFQVHAVRVMDKDYCLSTSAVLTSMT